ncbi:hypothetical protein BV22DRAFT_1032592 [Leucogyrophana mollusca]|uniref:Uncharacterized protein n=1 Tax=Leucogyrophana mollusca TaxID=85980 RepID=A0ACB8BMK3_9AGAM|nr:hypothetical protein BV22DRAFT_1032592 [Leucogyrophana mollusca]
MSSAISATTDSSIINTVLQGIAILLTLFRLVHRLSIGRFWWDDAWAAVALLCGTACVVSSWMYIRTFGKTSIVAYWVYVSTFNCLVWTVRMSILYSVTRLIHPSKSRRISTSVSIIFALLWSGLMIWKAYICGHDLYWYNLAIISCPFTHASDIYQLATDVISDAILVILPLRMLWNVKLPVKRQRRMVLSIFSSSILVSFVSLFRAICRLLNKSLLAFITGEIEVTVCLFVCSLLVTATYLDRFLRNDEEAPGSDATSAFDSHDRRRATTLYLTTVDLEHSGGDTSSSKRSQGLDDTHTHDKSWS